MINTFLFHFHFILSQFAFPHIWNSDLRSNNRSPLKFQPATLVYDRHGTVQMQRQVYFSQSGDTDGVCGLTNFRYA